MLLELPGVKVAAMTSTDERFEYVPWGQNQADRERPEIQEPGRIVLAASRSDFPGTDLRFADPVVA